MDTDDRQVGRILSRRELLALVGAAGATLLAGCAAGSAGQAQGATAATPSAPATTVPATAAAAPTSVPQVATSAAPTAAEVVAVPACVVRPEQTEGPYFVDEKLNRSDIRSDPASGVVKDGAPLALTLRVAQVASGGCLPLAGATVDIWHCDALGVYSDVTDRSFNTVGQQFLRGYQVTDANGVARFTTIYPGWYRGRTVHIHFKIRAADGTQHYEFTSQLYFDDALSDQVQARQPYAAQGQRTLRNDGDGIYRDGGEQLLLTVTPDGAGYAATFDIGMSLA